MSFARQENMYVSTLWGGVDDEEYAQECYALVDQLHLENVIFTGRVDIISYMEKLDFTILTSISEGQPLSVLESFAARRPCVTTDVGCCRELLNGNEEDRYGKQDIVFHRCIERARAGNGSDVRFQSSETPHGGECTETSESILSKKKK